MTKLYGIMMAVVVGMCISLQAPINTGLGKVITPKAAALHSFLTGTVILLFMNIFFGDLSAYLNIAKVQPIYWIGGLLGVGIVFLTIEVIPILGTGASFSIFVAVQLITGILIDHFGVLGVPRSPVGALKMAGIILILIGVRLVVK